MSTKNDIKSFLVANIPSQITAIAIDSSNIYDGQSRRSQTGDYEVWIKYLGHTPIIRGTGRLERHSLDIAIIAMGWDESNEDALASLLEDAADNLIAAYDENVSLFRANLTSTTVSWTRIVRGAIRAGRIEKMILLTLTLDEWVR